MVEAEVDVYDNIHGPRKHDDDEAATMSEARAGDASTRVFGTAELVRAIAAHVASQDLAAFRLVNRFAGVYGAPHQFVWHAYPWPKSRSFVRLGSGKEHLRHLRHIVVDTGVDGWQSFGDDFRLSDKRREQWSRLYDLLAAPELTGLETIDLKASICWASQIEGLTQPEFKRDNRLSTSLRSLCLTGITEAMDRHWEASLGRPWWNSVSNLIERCIDVQSSLGEVKLRHFHIGVEGDASILCGPPTVGFITTFRASLLGNLESLTLGKLSYDTSRALLGPLGLHPSAELSQQVQYDWPIWTRLQKLRISFGRGADAAASRLCDHVLDHCPVLQELYLTLGLSQPIRLVTTLGDQAGSGWYKKGKAVKAEVTLLGLPPAFPIHGTLPTMRSSTTIAPFCIILALTTSAAAAAASHPSPASAATVLPPGGAAVSRPSF
ncbi:hypothetical protein OC842_006845 [Tilletia horrida]|uniref:Uncharacterized protein n=1 Tax=Tilletia horrida TaxID=155126 RepID=A0AAN6G532_9BASI|nr:hypothetical protein OC842_006845 [Tilletia horrida]